HTNDDWFFNGSIDEVRIWNRSLSASEIKQQYYSSLNKYAPDKWLFTFIQQSQPSGTHNYTLYVDNGNTVFNSTQTRTVLVG
ncbi:MAG: LamG-like jellyroll fold domain-containing protein, partial [Candidatus Micrarchaeia archaeon]